MDRIRFFVAIFQGAACNRVRLLHHGVRCKSALPVYQRVNCCYQAIALINPIAPYRRILLIMQTALRRRAGQPIGPADLMLPTAQSSVNFVCGEGFRNKIADPLPDVIVLRVSGVLKHFEEFRKSGRASAVLGRTIPISRHTKLPKRFVSQQNFFEKKLVLPAIAKIVLVQ